MMVRQINARLLKKWSLRGSLFLLLSNLVPQAMAASSPPPPPGSAPVSIISPLPLPTTIVGTVQIQNTDSRGLIPYQITQTEKACGGGPFLTNCTYTFPAVANSKRLVITNFSYHASTSGFFPYELKLENGLVTVFLVFTSNRGSFSGGEFSVVNSSQPILLYVDSGGQPKVTISVTGGSESVFTDGATISGYLLDCAVSPGCPAITP